MSEIKLYPIPAAGFVLFAAGVFLGIPLNLVGNLLVGEILLGVFAAVGMIANFGNPKFLDRRLMLFTGLFFLSLCVYVATDFFLETEMRDAVRGWARFVFLIVDFMGIYVIARKSRFNLFPLFIGYMVGQVLVWARPQPGFPLYISIWKHHLCLPVLIGLLCIIALCARRAAIVWSIAALTLTGFVSFQIDTRAFGLLCFLAAAMMAARMIVFPRLRTLMPLALLAFVLLSAFAVTSLLDQTHDRFGRRQLGSNEMRYAAIVTALQTISDHPWLGIGSWKTDFEAANRHRANVVDAGGAYDGESSNQSGHSQLVQAWLEGGPLAALAFFYLFWRMLASLWWTLTRPMDRFLAFAIFALLNGIWSCLFSPFLGADIRINAAIAIYVCIVLAREKGESRNRSLARA